MHEAVQEWMTAPVVSVTTTTDLHQAACLMRDHAIRHLPVLRADQRCVGMLSDMGVFAHGHWMSGRWHQRDPGGVTTFMEPPRCTTEPVASTLEVMQAMYDQRTDHALVEDANGSPLGIFTENDIVRLGARHLPPDLPWPKTRKPITCESETPVLQALQLMLEREVRHLIVVNEFGSLVGIVSVRDLVSRPADWPVKAAMPFALVHQVPPGTPLRAVAEKMSLLGVGALVVVEGTRPVGIHTRTDVLDALLFFHTYEDTSSLLVPT